MAYFSQLNTLLNQQNQPRKSDSLLAPSNSQQEQSGQGQGGSLQLSAPSQSIGAGGNKAEQGQSATDYTKVTGQGRGAAAQNILDANRGAQAADAKSFGAVRIADSQKTLQDTANKYRADNVYNSSIADQDINAAQMGDSGSFDKISGLLNRTYQAPKDFAYSNESDADKESYVKNLSSVDGLQNTLRKARGDATDYNDSAATLDALLLNDNAGFKAQKADLIGQFGAYDQSKRDAVAAAKNTQDQFGKNFDAEQTDVRNRVESAGERIKGDLGRRLEDSRAQRAASLSLQGGEQLSKGSKIRGELQARFDDIKAKYPELAGAVDASSGSVFAQDMPDVNKFVSQGENNLNLDSITNQSDQDQFAQLMSLLGRGDRLGRSDVKQNDSGFDEAGYRAALDERAREQFENLATKTGDRDRVLQSERDTATAQKIASAAKSSNGITVGDVAKGNEGAVGGQPRKKMEKAPRSMGEFIKQMVEKSGWKDKPKHVINTVKQAGFDRLPTVVPNRPSVSDVAKGNDGAVGPSPVPSAPSIVDEIVKAAEGSPVGKALDFAKKKKWI